jgi:hypothetical protein
MHWLTLAALLAAPSHARRVDTTACTPARDIAPLSWMHRAEQAVGITRAGGRVLRVTSVYGALQDYQSDRSYPPFFSLFTATTTWLDPATGVERTTSRLTFPGFEGAGPVTIGTPRSTVLERDTTLAPAPALHRQTLIQRDLNPWAVLRDWAADSTLRAMGRCQYRDYERVVLARRGPFGEERLFLDPKTGFPVKLDRMEPNFLWGQVHVEYVYSTWLLGHGVVYPGASFRLVDGGTQISSTNSAFDLLPRDSVPSLALPANAPAMTPTLPAFLQAAAPDTIRVGAATVLLKNGGYTEAVTLARDTVFVFDATQGEARARQDSVLIGALFPGRHPVVLVVTDLAWPHIAGVRFWVASGATIVSHRASRAFLERVVARRWTRAPDKLERARQRVRFRFRAVSDSMSLAGGEILLQPIDGIASEGALMAYMRKDRFLWASDYVQSAQAPKEYTREVWNAAMRAGIRPDVVAAEHLDPTPWTVIRGLVAGVDAGGS